MRVVNYTEFRTDLADNLNAVSDNSEIVVVSRTKGKNVVVMSLAEYNSIQETLYISSTKANRKQLDLAIAEMNAGKFVKRKLALK